MKVLKVFAAVILSAIMICSTVMAMGSFATEQATTKANIRHAIDETGIVSELMDQVLERSTSNLGGLSSSVVRSIIETDSMEDYIADYMTEAIEDQVYGRQRQDIDQDELMDALAGGIDEAASENGITLSDTETAILKYALQQSMPILADEINKNLDAYQTTAISEEIEQTLQLVQFIINPVFRYGCLIITGLAALALIVLFWGSRMGFMWAAVNILIASAAFAVLTLTANSLGADATFVKPTERMIYIMCSGGTTNVAIAGGITGVILIIICVIMRTVRRPV